MEQESRLADLLEGRSSEIVNEFIVRVRAGIAAQSLPYQDARDSLLEFIRDLAAQLRERSSVSETPLNRPASHHGEQRFRLGYDIGGVIREYGTLHDVIFDFIDRQKTRISQGEYRLFSQFLLSAVADAATQHEKKRDDEMQRLSARHIGFLAHELRNPLSSARMAVRLLLERKEFADNRTSQALTRSLDQLAELIDRALIEQRLRAGPAVSPEAIDVPQLLADLAAESAIEAEARRQQLHVEANVQRPLVADLRLLRSALSNLIRNAVKFSRAGGTVSLRAKEAQGRVVIEVEDECGGLPDGEVQKLFDPFVQAGKDRSGFGLGLAIARQAVEAHEGAIRVHDLPGKGCVFVLDLPADLPGAASGSI
jgi:signal transduction histidine kinase